MLRYLTDIGLQHSSLPIQQHLIYIGKAPLSMPAGLREPDLDYRYTVLDMHKVGCSGLLAQDNPDALVLAMLCDFGVRQPQAVVNGIFLRLRQLVGDDSRRLREYIDMIEVSHTEQLRLARNLLDLLSDEVIAERTGLPLETVIRLRNGEDLD